METEAEHDNSITITDIVRTTQSYNPRLVLCHSSFFIEFSKAEIVFEGDQGLEEISGVFKRSEVFLIIQIEVLVANVFCEVFLDAPFESQNALIIARGIQVHHVHD